MRAVTLTASAAAFALAAGCAASVDRLYVESIRQSAVVSPADVFPLRPLVAGPDGNVTVTTWAHCGNTDGANRCRGYVPGRVTVTWDVWVVDDAEFRTACGKLRGDMSLRVSQLLGLPPPRTPLAPDSWQRQFVTMTAPIGSVFRPCTDPRVDTDRCSTALPATLPSNAPPDFYRWFTNQAMASWVIPATGQPADGYPWTRLGYTYNWAPDAASRYGVSEYVIPGASRPVDVTVLSIRTMTDYCGVK